MAPWRVIETGWSWSAGGGRRLERCPRTGRRRHGCDAGGRTNHHLFQPLLYQVAAGILAPDLIAPALRRTVKKQANARTLLAEVYHLDLERKVVVAREPDGRMLELAGGALLDRGRSLSVRLGAEAAAGERKASQHGGWGLLKVAFPGRGGHLCWGRLQAADLGGPWGGEAVDRRTQIGAHGLRCGRQRHPSTVATASRSSCPSAKAQSASSYSSRCPSLEAPAIVRSGWPTSYHPK